MNIRSVQLTQFRNYQSAALSFSEGTNIIYGANAQGKTNLLEAVFLFCGGRSHRGAGDREIIAEGSEYAVAQLEFSDGVRDYRGAIKLFEGKRREITVNGVKIKKASHMGDYINAVMFAPEDLAIVKDTPALRRRFMDMAISQLRPAYVSCLSDYIKALTQRNNLLRAHKTAASCRLALDAWDEALAGLGARIMWYRHEFICALCRQAERIYRDISGEALSVRYAANVCGDLGEGETIKTVQTKLLSQLERSRSRDLAAGVTCVGVHRDDLALFVDGRDARRFGSQGQQRSVVLSLKLAQTELIFALKNSYPVVLLDDIMSELDASRRGYLAGKIADKQVILTCTDRYGAPMDGAVKYFYVENGTVREDG